MIVVIYCYLERHNDEVLKFHWNNFRFFEIKASLFKCRPPVSATTQCFQIKRDIRLKLHPCFYGIFLLILWIKSIVQSLVVF